MTPPSQATGKPDQHTNSTNKREDPLYPSGPQGLMDQDSNSRHCLTLERVGKTPATGQVEKLPHPSPDPVAHPDPIITENGKNPIYYNNILSKLLLQLVVITGKVAPMQIERLFLKLKKTGLWTPRTLSIYYYFICERALTIPMVVENLEIPTNTAYATVKKLHKNKLITLVTKTNAFKVGGAKCGIYAVPDYTSDDIRKCHEMQSKRKQPIYESAVRIAASLDEYMIRRGIKEITKTVALTQVINKFELRGWNRKFVIEQSLNMLQEKGYKVWR